MSIQFRTRTKGFGVVPEELTGACCLQGECSESTLAECSKLGGNFIINGVCDDGICDLDDHGACCDRFGFCYYVNEDGCKCRGGIWHGEKTNCIDYNCCDSGITAAAQACCIGQWGGVGRAVDGSTH